MKNYFAKMKGVSKSPPRVSFTEIALALFGSFLGMGAIALLHFFLLRNTSLPMLVGSFGASAVLVFGACKSPLAQPRNVIGGHIVSALVGVSVFLLFGTHTALAIALSVSLAISIMHITNTLHPPGGATALIAVIGGAPIHSLGYLYAILPCAAGAIIMVIIGLFTNNLHNKHNYPQFWL